MRNGEQSSDSTPEKQELPEVVQVVNENVKPYTAFFTKFNNDWSLTLARALAYNLLTAMFPIALVLLAVLGIILGGLDPHAEATLVAHLQGIFPKGISSGDLISTVLHQLSRVSGVLGVIAILLALFTGSRLFILIEKCFTIIYRLHSRRFVSQNIMAIGMVLLFIVLTPIMIFASTVPIFLVNLLKNTPLAQAPGIGFIYTLAGILGSLLVAIILFQAIYIVVPNQHISFSKSWRGTLVAAVALQIYLTFFPLYASRFLGGYIGQVGFAIILLAFFYYFGVILLLGAEINAFFSEHIRSKTGDLAELMSITESKEDGEQSHSATHIDSSAGSLLEGI